MSLVSEFLSSLQVRQREKIAHTIGRSGGYLSTLASRKSNGKPIEKVSLSLAVAIDKASGGKLNFKDIVVDAENVDWKYLKKKLRIK